MPETVDAQAAPAVDMDVLGRALGVMAPKLNYATWRGPLAAAFAMFGLTTPRRVAAAMGQFLVEAGPDFSGIVEDLYYTTPARLVDVYPSEITSVSQAVLYTCDAPKLGNFVYAGRGGNGDVASCDGYLFRGRGLIQVTGRDAYTALAAALGKALGEVTFYCQTPAGAAMSGCWWLATHGCLELADAWNVAAITRAVNGAAMEDADTRLTYATYLLKELSAGKI